MPEETGVRYDPFLKCVGERQVQLPSRWMVIADVSLDSPRSRTAANSIAYVKDEAVSFKLPVVR